jgi:hypothetical protein
MEWDTLSSIRFRFQVSGFRVSGFRVVEVILSQWRGWALERMNAMLRIGIGEQDVEQPPPVWGGRLGRLGEGD